jgi:hypothetical protein
MFMHQFITLSVYGGINYILFYVQEWKDALQDSEALLKLLTPAV